jgi:hypothetical protein
MSDYFNWLAMPAAVKRLPPPRRLGLCTDFTERVIRVFENYANANVPDEKAYFSDMRDLLFELRRDL